MTPGVGPQAHLTGITANLFSSKETTANLDYLLVKDSVTMGRNSVRGYVEMACWAEFAHSRAMAAEVCYEQDGFEHRGEKCSGHACPCNSPLTIHRAPPSNHTGVQPELCSSIPPRKLTSVPSLSGGQT